MRNYIAGVITGIVIATVGITGVMRMLDTGVHKVQSVAKEVAQ